jgi:hypothetical protein
VIRLPFTPLVRGNVRRRLMTDGREADKWLRDTKVMNMFHRAHVVRWELARRGERVVTQVFHCDCGRRLNIPGAIGAAGMLKRSGWVMGKDGVWSCSVKCRPVLPDSLPPRDAGKGEPS